MFDASGDSEAKTTDELSEANNKHVSNAAVKNDLIINPPFLGLVCFCCDA